MVFLVQTEKIYFYYFNKFSFEKNHQTKNIINFCTSWKQLTSIFHYEINFLSTECIINENKKMYEFYKHEVNGSGSLLLLLLASFCQDKRQNIVIFPLFTNIYFCYRRKNYLYNIFPRIIFFLLFRLLNNVINFWSRFLRPKPRFHVLITIYYFCNDLNSPET